jgi:hypothetical protein
MKTLTERIEELTAENIKLHADLDAAQRAALKHYAAWTENESLRHQLGIMRTSDGREARLGVTSQRVTELRELAAIASNDYTREQLLRERDAPATVCDALIDAVRFYDLVRKAWEGTNEEYGELEQQQLARDEAIAELAAAGCCRGNERR